MAYSEKLASRIRESLNEVLNVKEKKMMGGLTFMVNDKMCVGIFKDELMCRIDPDVQEEALSMQGCRLMEFTGRPMHGFVLVNDSGMKSKKQFDYWMRHCLDFNRRAKPSKKKSDKTR